MDFLLPGGVLISIRGGMKRRKLAFYILLAALVGLLIVGWLAISGILKDPARNAEADMAQFFKHLRNERYYDAYNQIATRLKEVSFEGFERSILRHELDKVSTTDWETRKVGGTEATFSGVFDFFGGKRDEITVKLVRERSQWRVYSVVSRRAGNLITESSGIQLDSSREAGKPMDLSVPSDENMQRLVNGTLMSFNEAIQIQYFGSFYQSISTAWQQQTTATNLTEAFKVFIEKGVSFAALRDAKAEFIFPPIINDYGILLAEGYYIDGTRRVNFRMKYVNEQDQWRLFGLDISLVDSQREGGG